jgi:hypothetical protein
MKNYSMTLNHWTFEMEVWMHRNDVSTSDYYFYDGKRVERTEVPAKLLSLFDGFSEDVVNQDWDPDYGFQGNLSDSEPKFKKVGG